MTPFSLFPPPLLSPNYLSSICLQVSELINKLEHECNTEKMQFCSIEYEIQAMEEIQETPSRLYHYYLESYDFLQYMETAKLCSQTLN